MGSCRGDSGGPLVMLDFISGFYTLVGVLHGSKDQCKDDRTDAPSLFARVDHPDIFHFIEETKEDLERCQRLKDCYPSLKNTQC